MYDAAGNATGYGGLTFTYSDAGRMTSVTSGSGTTSYLVNALGQRVKKAGPAGTRLFVYDEAGHLIGEYDGAGALIEETVWLEDIPVATLRPNGAGGVNVFYVHTDHLNTPRRISRPSDNAILWRWDSDPFGTNAANEDPDGDATLFTYKLRFPGQYFDAESGLHYNYLRDGYDPAVGRYTQSDPIGFGGGVNTYVYVSSNPVSGADAFGLSEYEDQVGAVGYSSAATALDLANRARSVAESSGLPGLHNGPADALRHCTWSCLMARHLGQAKAKIIADIHEANNRAQSQPMAEEQMDQANNAVGRQCVKPGSVRPVNCPQRCIDKLMQGFLYELDGSTMDPPPKWPDATRLQRGGYGYAP